MRDDLRHALVEQSISRDLLQFQPPTDAMPPTCVSELAARAEESFEATRQTRIRDYHLRLCERASKRRRLRITTSASPQRHPPTTPSATSRKDPPPRMSDTSTNHEPQHPTEDVREPEPLDEASLVQSSRPTAGRPPPLPENSRSPLTPMILGCPEAVTALAVCSIEEIHASLLRVSALLRLLEIRPIPDLI